MGQTFSLQRICNPPAAAYRNDERGRLKIIENRPQAASLPHKAELHFSSAREHSHVGQDCILRPICNRPRAHNRTPAPVWLRLPSAVGQTPSSAPDPPGRALEYFGTAGEPTEGSAAGVFACASLRNAKRVQRRIPSNDVNPPASQRQAAEVTKSRNRFPARE